MLAPSGAARATFGVERDWRFAGRDGSRPRVAPGEPPPAVKRIDVPPGFDATGRRLT